LGNSVGRLQMSENSQHSGPVEPPADVPEIQRGNWLTLPATDPVAEYVTETLWDHPERPVSWKVARLSQAAYIYRETSVGWAVVAKFYAVKAGSSAGKYAARELDCIRQIQATNMAKSDARAIEPLGLWRGVLFLEYVDGLTLEDTIAVRRSQPGALSHALERAARFLAGLHGHSVQSDAEPDFRSPVSYAHAVVDQLARHGVLQDYPIACDGVARLIDRWAASPAMEDFVPSLTHGDATTSNFVFPKRGGVVVVDWERLYVGDPASDVGRLMAEVTHSINQHGGSVGEARPFVQHMVDTYRQALPADWDADALVERTRFYRASSTLRIARNGWISRLDRTALVAQAMALLADEF
jgi:aminoglycoside phosphotransferase (APT) family kinase protein